jgi:4-diphosphocytidyl-2-C-methyl-D-erythritol kinase
MRWERTKDGLKVWAPAKLNLYLEIGPKRPDGFHEIDSIFQAIALYDELEFEKTSDGQLSLEEAGIAAAEKNLVFRAARQLKELLLERRLVPPGTLLGARVRLKKRIPEGAGLGGGSSDAAATLLALSSLWGVRLSAGDLLSVSLSLGSDVPFFLVGGTARCRGRGEKVESWAGPFAGKAFHYVLVYPRVKVSTQWAYNLLDGSRRPEFALTGPSPLDSMPAETIRDQLSCGQLFFNRFEETLYPALPDLEKLHANMRREPFLRVLLTGSGSTLYGLCRDEEEASEIASRLRARVAGEVFSVQSERHQDDLPGQPSL